MERGVLFFYVTRIKVSQVAAFTSSHYFSNSFQKLARNEYYSKLVSGFRSYALRTYLIF